MCFVLGWRWHQTSFQEPTWIFLQVLENNKHWADFCQFNYLFLHYYLKEVLPKTKGNVRNSKRSNPIINPIHLCHFLLNLKNSSFTRLPLCCTCEITSFSLLDPPSILPALHFTLESSLDGLHHWTPLPSSFSLIQPMDRQQRRKREWGLDTYFPRSSPARLPWTDESYDPMIKSTAPLNMFLSINSLHKLIYFPVIATSSQKLGVVTISWLLVLSYCTISWTIPTSYSHNCI